MITQSDDSGRCKVSVSLFKARVHPLNNYKAETFKADLEKLNSCGLMRSYFVDGEWFMHHPNWNIYQYIQKPKPSKLPVPDEYNTITIPVTPNRIELNGIELNGTEVGIQPKPKPQKIEVAPDTFLTEAQRDKLIADFGEEAYTKKRDEFSNGVGNKFPATKYKDHYKTIRNWIQRDMPLSPKKPKTDTRVKHCENCDTDFQDATSICPKCGYPWSPPRPKEAS
jgi:hypothetical protein